MMPLEIPTCNDCVCMAYRDDRQREIHRYCGLYHQWIPYNEMFPVCDSHTKSKKKGDKQ